MKLVTHLGFLLLAFGVNAAFAQTNITQWNFNSNPPDASTSTGSLSPSFGAGTLTAVGGATTNFASGTSNGGSSDPATTDNTGLGVTTWPVQGTNNKTAGIEFRVSTIGYADIVVTFDLRHSNTGPRHLQFQYTTNISATTPVWQDFAIDAATGGDTWFARSYNLNALTALNNNANVAFRVVAAFDAATSNYLASNSASSYSTSGTWRFDMVTVKGNTTGGDVTPPVAQMYNFIGATSSFIKFSEPVTTATATNLANYSFSPALAISNATLSTSGDTVFLSHAAFTNGLPYTITVNNVQDVALNSMTSAASFNTIFNNSLPNLIITEIIHSPNDIEMIEVYNAGTTAISLGGLKWTDGTTGNFPVTNLAAGATAVFATAPTTAAASLNVPTIYTINNGLGSSNDILVIRNSLNQIVDSVDYYVGTNGWPTAPTGVYGYSFELMNANADNNVGSNWVVPINTITPQPTVGIIRATPGVYPAPTVAPTLGTLSFLTANATVTESTSTVRVIARVQNVGNAPASANIELVPFGTATNNVDFTLPTNLTFNWEANANNVNDTILITINPDAIPENTEYFVVRFTNVQNLQLPAASSNHFTVFVQDDDKQAPVANQSITLNHIASFSNGTAGSNSAEIVAHDPISQRLFIANSVGAKIDIVNFSNPTNATLINSINITPYGNINSVAVKNGIVAAAVENTNPQANGKVVFFTTNGVFISQVDVGAMPDMIAFNHAGTKVFTANEGEPNTTYSDDPEGSISIIDISGGVASINNSNVTTLGFSGFNSQLNALKAAGVRIFGLNATVAKDLEPEYVTISADDATAWVVCQENNAIVEINLNTNTITQIRAISNKDHALFTNALDASDQGGNIHIANWPVKGVLMPDAMASYTVGGQTYLVTANEGDAREYTAYSEITRLSATTYKLDSTIFPYADIIKANIGRLNVTTASGDTDGDGDFDEIHVFGARSFSIINATTGALVWDSGDQFEEIIAKHPTLAAIFNASNANNTFKNRSDDKGPEPEGVVIAEIGGRFFAFIALERIGGCMVYDITNPNAPVFVDYKNTRTVAAYGGDNGSEGIVYISAANSPTSTPMVILANEVSSTLTFLQVNATALPVKLSSINAYNAGKSNVVYWQTATEEQGDNFEVEKSSNGSTFTQLALVKATGQPNNYSVTDNNPFDAVTYYRLKINNNNGSISYSSVVKVNTKSTISLNVAPNPFSNNIQVVVPQESVQDAMIELHTLNGVLLKSIKVNNSVTNINTQNLAKGQYIITFKKANYTESVMLLKQ